MKHFRNPFTQPHPIPPSPLVVSLLFSALTLALPVHAQSTKITPPDPSPELRRQDERTQAQRQREEPSVDVQSPAITLESARLPSPESPCFRIDAVQISNIDQSPVSTDRVKLQGDDFVWLMAALAGPQGDDSPGGKCLGAKGVALVLKRAQEGLLQRGFVTSRVLAQEQDLSSGTLALTLLPGHVNTIRFKDAGAPGVRLGNSVPIHSGDLLNLRDVEQGLENLKRVPTAEADIQIEPAQDNAAPGQSDLVISYQQQSPARFSLTVDDSGSKGTGIYQGSATLAAQGSMTLSAQSLSSSAASLLAAGMKPDGNLRTDASTANLSITTVEALQARGQNLAAKDLRLIGADIDASTGITSAANVVLSATSGNVSTRGATLVTPGTLAVQANTLASQVWDNSALDASTGNLPKASSVQAGQLNIAAAKLNNRSSEIVQTGTTGLADFRIANTIDNTSGRIASNSDLQLGAQDLLNQGGKITAKNDLTGNVALAIDNSTSGLIGAGRNVTLSADSLNNTDATLVAVGGGLTLSTSADTTNMGGILQSGGNLRLSNASLGNGGGLAQAGGNLTVITAALNNQAGKLLAMGDMYITASNAAHNASADNTGGLVRSLGTLELQTDTLTNKDTYAVDAKHVATDQGLEGKSVSLQANTVDNTGGAIRADESMAITAVQSLRNDMGLISSSGSLLVRDATLATAASAGAAPPLTRALQLSNTQGVINASSSNTIQALSSTGDGRILSQGDLSLDVTSDFTNTGAVIANGNMQLTSTGAVSNSGALQAGKALTLTAQNVDNARTGAISSIDTTLVRVNNILTNWGLIDGVTTRIDAGTVCAGQGGWPSHPTAGSRTCWALGSSACEAWTRQKPSSGSSAWR